MLDDNFLEKAKEAGSAEELVKLAKEHSIDITEEKAEKYLAKIKNSTKNGELEDDDLDSVSGGACHIKVDGKKRTVVTSGLKCFTGLYREASINAQTTSDVRADWYTFSSKGCCGKCEYLDLHWGIGFCSKS